MRTRKGYSATTVKAGETALPWHLMSLPDAIRRALGELIEGANRGKRDEIPALGEKALASHFDGKDSREVAGSTVSRWRTEPTRFPAHCLPTLIALHPQFRSFVFGHLAVRMVPSSEVLSAMKPEAAREYERVVLEAVAADVFAPVQASSESIRRATGQRFGR